MSLGFHQGFPRGGRGIACRSSQSLVDTESQGGTGGHGKHLLLKETRLLRTAKHAKRKPSPQPDLSQNQPTNTRPPHPAPRAKCQDTKKLNDFPFVSNRSFPPLALASRSPDSIGFPCSSPRLLFLASFAHPWLKITWFLLTSFQL